MNSLFLTPEQAHQIADDLHEYCKMKDSSDRELFESFEIKFPDNMKTGTDKGEGLTIHPVANWLEIDPDVE